MKRDFKRSIASTFALILLLITPALAVLPDEVLKDPALEARARVLSQDLRCLVCQNQSIDDSNAPLARDLRLIVRERLTAGDSDTQVIAYLVSRYGNYVLLKPPFQRDTALLWLAPFGMLLLAMAVASFYFLKRSRDTTQNTGEPLSDEDLRVFNSLSQDS
jgi:cytochrome c-type biogenesis protein CcmH